jgi:hypothetical protein
MSRYEENRICSAPAIIAMLAVRAFDVHEITTLCTVKCSRIQEPHAHIV